MPDILPDIRHAARGLARRPGFALVAVLTLALGVGTSTGVFTFAYAILVAPLPYADAGRLVTMSDITHGEKSGVGMSNWRDWRGDNTVFEDIALTEGTADVLGGQAGDEAERVQGADVTSSFFEVLGVRPFVGRAFGPEDEFKGRDVGVIVLSHRLWQRRFDGRPDIVGRVIAFNGRPCTVVGVMPQGFWYVENGAAEYFVPQRWSGSGRGQHQYGAVARLKPGVTLEQAQAQMSAIARRIELEYPQAHGWGVLLTSLRDDVTEGVREPLAILAAAVGLVLLVACANLGSLLLVRAGSRARETAVRAALGASRPRMVQEVVAEAGVIALAGGAAGLAGGAVLVRLVLRAIPAQYQLPMTPSVDWRVVAFALLVAAASALASSVVPMWRATRVDLVQALGSSGASPGMGRGHSRLLRATIVGELALASVLLVAGALLASSLVSMLHADLGFDTRDLLTMQVRPLGGNAALGEPAAFYDELLDRVARLPWVKSAAATWSMPLSNQFSGSGFTIGGRAAPAEWRKMSAQNCVVTPDYFRTMGMRLVRGRNFDERDRAGAPEVVIVNQALATRHWPDGNPLGATMTRGRQSFTVVGVVSDVRYNGPTAAIPPAMYRPLAQEPSTALFLVVRTSGNQAGVVAGIRRQLRDLNRGAALIRVQTMEDLLVERVGGTRLVAGAMGGFAALALLLAGVGLYGAMAQWVAQRRRELGVRVALGATGSQVVGLVLGRGLVLSVAGAAGGLAIAAAVTRTMAALLFGVSPRDPAVFAGVPVLVVLVALAACYLPARRASRVDPIEALRSE
jgi:putative ABC transport system permease protein